MERNNDRRLRVLVGAYACHPHRGSEPGVGWSWIEELSKHCDIDVVTADYEGSRRAIGELQATDRRLKESIKFHFLPDFTAQAWAKHPFLMRYYQPLYYKYYKKWMWEAYGVAKALAREVKFDLVHQLTMIGYREPGYMWLLPLPFVWGPIGGTQNVPASFLASLGLVEGGRHAARGLINSFQFRFGWRFRMALRKASGIMCTAEDTQRLLLSHYGVHSEVVAASLAPVGKVRGRVRTLSRGATIHLVFSGLHSSLKGLPFALRALATVGREVPWLLDVLGAGGMTEKWKREAWGLGINDRVRWHGHLERSKAIEVMDMADVFVFPSLKEGSPAVIAEALALGLPVITTKHHGMADYIDESCGIKVSVRNPDSLVKGMALAVRELAERPERVETLSIGALERANRFSPGSQIPRLLEIYRKTLSAKI